MSDLEAVIEDSIADATAQVDTDPTPEVDTPVETAPEVPEAHVEATEETPEEAGEVQSPAAKPVVETKVDDFDKKHGLQAQIGGRENRIPYSRVKKIVEKAIADRRKEVEGEFTPKVSEYETKVKGYEERLARVDQFEKIMVNDPDKFLNMLSTVPAYRDFFRAIEQAFSPQSQTPAAPQEVKAPVGEAMPEPDQPLPDGTRVYSMDGLKSLLEWHGKTVESKVTKQVEDRYKPIEAEWQTNQRIQAVIPQIQAQIADARTWDNFTENEAEIVKVLQGDRNISLERAYQKVVLPKMQAAWAEKEKTLAADRNKVREEVLAELKKAPRSTSAPSTGSKPVASTSNEPRSLEDIIAEQVKTLKG